MNPIEQFRVERQERITNNGRDDHLLDAAQCFLRESLRVKYSYNFKWMGRPVIQYPQDMMALQEIIFQIRPDLIVETGIAHGGSLVFFASMLELLGGDGRVLGIDVDIRAHNRAEIEGHPMFHRIEMIEGSSVDEEVVSRVLAAAEGRKTVMVCLDSDHAYDHVLKELQLYSPMVTLGSYLVVFDGIIEQFPEYTCQDRSWNSDNNPLKAIRNFLAATDRFVPDREIENKITLTAAPSGYLKRVA